MHYFVTGCAGFIGSNLVDRLLNDGNKVTGFDNFSTGQQEFLQTALRFPEFTLIEGDLLDESQLENAMRGSEFVIHLAANADVRFGLNHPRKDLEQNTIATFHVLEAMRNNGIKKIGFASTGSVYGEPEVFPTPENAPFPVQTSLYAASKLACEALIQAYSEGFHFQGYIFRFVGVLGRRYTHGHVLDFYRQLTQHPDTLNILGNGKQRKSYMHIDDCMDAMLLIMDRSKEKVNLYNLGYDEYCTVDDSIGWICEHVGAHPELQYGGGERGWIGDNPFIYLDCARLRALGWKPRMSIREAIISTVEYLKENSWILERRT